MNTQFSFFDSDVPIPLADKMRPTNLDEFVGQEHILSLGMPLRSMIDNDLITSMIFWGPPGVGKTTLARIIANLTSSDYHELSAVVSGVKDIKEMISRAKNNRISGIRTIVFIDEIHRFNKIQQDALLPDVENGNITLIGATTENPSFEVNNALLSRTIVYRLNALRTEDINKIIIYALTSSKGFGNQNVIYNQEVVQKIAISSGGDARTALNFLELLIQFAPKQEDGIVIDEKLLKTVLPQKAFLYGKKSDEHYDCISALHKSMRNSDCQAAAYWLERMLQAGEDPIFIARRLIRFASEDIGLADPTALCMAISAYNAVRYVGMPECDVNLMQAVIYMSMTLKSNSLYKCCEKAKDIVAQTQTLSVPFHLRNASTELERQLGYGVGYQYAHDCEDSISMMECLPSELSGIELYVPTNNGKEKVIADRMEYIKKRKEG